MTPMLIALGALVTTTPIEHHASTLAINRRWEVLAPAHTDRQRRKRLRRASRLLDVDIPIELAGIAVTPALLKRLATRRRREPLLRVVREGFRRAMDLDDFLLFLDDILVEQRWRGIRRKRYCVSASRARSAGILLHPDDVFRSRQRRYGHKRDKLVVDPPAHVAGIESTVDDDVLGAHWSTRFRDPKAQSSLTTRLAESSPDFYARVNNLLSQLRNQGADVYLTSTVRSRKRGYLMWGAYYLSRSKDDVELADRITELEELNGEWGLNIAIRWRHPDGLDATREAARKMSDAFDVVYATRHGAERSDHYDGKAVDFVALALPRRLTLRAPDSTIRTFDLSDAKQPRDLNLTPSIIAWVEEHFDLVKLKRDYPHWSDRAR